MESPAQGRNQRQSISVPAPLPSPSLDLSEKPANRLTIEPATNPNPGILHLHFLYNENIANLLEAMVKMACDTDEDIASAEKKRTQGKVALLLNKDKDVAPTKKKRNWGKGKVCLKK